MATAEEQVKAFVELLGRDEEAFWLLAMPFNRALAEGTAESLAEAEDLLAHARQLARSPDARGAVADMAQRLLYRVVEQARPWEEGGALPIRLQLAAFQLRPALPRQAGMFAQPGPGDDKRLRRALEAVRHRVGPGYLRLAGEPGLSWREARLALLEQGAWLP